MDPALPIEKITISGPILASIIHRSTSSPGDIDGLLFGHIAPLPPPPLVDDPSPTSAAAAASSSSPTPTSPFSATITNLFISGAPLSFFSPRGRLDPPSLARFSPAAPRLLGWLSARRLSPARPSMRELAVTRSLSQTARLTFPDFPCLFLLLTSDTTQPVHTHEYKIYAGQSLVPRPLIVSNLGMVYREQYRDYAPLSAFPPVKLGAAEGEGESLKYKKRLAGDRFMLDKVAEGFGVERLRQLAGIDAVVVMSGVEDMYERTLERVGGLAREVEESSSLVLEKEKYVLTLRSKLAGLE